MISLLNLIILVVVGALISLLLNYLADVLPETRRFSRPKCKKCGHPFSTYEYLIAFRCPGCKTRPGIRYWLAMILGMVIVPLMSIFPMKPLNPWESVILMAFLGLIMIIDIEHRAVLFETDFVGLALGILYGLLIHKGYPWDVLWGGLLAAGIMFLLYNGGILFNKVVSKIRKQEMEQVALGFGDVIVCGYLGMIVGIHKVIGFILLTIIFSGVFAIFYVLIKKLAKKYNAFSAIPYVPFMILAFLFLFYSPL